MRSIPIIPVKIPALQKESAMAEKEKQDNEGKKWQAIFDNVWLLFLLSLLISGVIYNAWGLFDLLHVPPAP